MRCFLIALVMAASAGCGGAADSNSGGATGASGVAATDQDRLQGRWLLIDGEGEGKKQPLDDPFLWAFTGSTWEQFDVGDNVAAAVGPFTLDESQTPRTITIDVRPSDPLGQGMQIQGVYELDGDTLRVCYGSGVRPTALKTAPGEKFALITLRRQAK
jgi:uncharacterized protein (TIGR03067 family)